MVVGIAGSRKRNTPEDYKLLRKRIIDLKPTLIVTTGIRYEGPDVFAKEIAKELGIPLKEYPCTPEHFPPEPERRVDRRTELWARDLRRSLVGLASDYLLFMPSPKGKFGEIITCYWFIITRTNAFDRYAKIEML